MKSDTETYELAYLFHPDISNDKLLTAAEKIKNIIFKHNGTINKEETAKKRKLAYPIKKQTYGYFGAINFSIKPSSINELNKTFTLENDILRHLMILIPKEVIKKSEKEFKLKIQKLGKPEKAVSKPKETAQAIKEQVKVELAELDKKLEEILGK